MAYEAGKLCPLEIIYDINDYYALYPEYRDEEDIAQYAQLDPTIPLSRLAMAHSARLFC